MKYLAKLYPVYPRGRVDVWELACLDEKYEPSSWQERYNESIRETINQYYSGSVCLYNSKLRHYNNSTWYMGEADTIFDFIKQFEKELKNDRGDSVVS